MPKLQATYDDGIVTYPELSDVLEWRTWKQNEIERIEKVAAGQLRRFSTTHRNVPCDLEPYQSAE